MRELNGYSRNPLAVLLLALIPIFVVFTPLVPEAVRLPVICFWLLFVPLRYWTLTYSSLAVFLISTIFLLSRGFEGIAKEPTEGLLITISLSVAVYVAYGYRRRATEDLEHCLAGLAWGGLVVNLSTLLAMLLIFEGFLELEMIAATFNISDQLGLWRFALGNAIEVPFLTTLCTIVGIRYIANRPMSWIIVIINVSLVLISQSRGIILIALVHMFIHFRNVSFVSVLIATIAFATVATIYQEEILTVYDSIVVRFMGEDYGSGDMRAHIVQSLLNEMSAYSLLFGEGVRASAQQMYYVSGQVQTVESAALELLFDFGLLFSLLVLMPFLAILMRSPSSLGRKLLAIMCIMQMLLLLPITPMFALTFSMVLLSLMPYRSSTMNVKGGSAFFGPKMRAL